MTNLFMRKRRTLLSYKKLLDSRTERITAGRRLSMLFDNGKYEKLYADLKTRDPLEFPDYKAKREAIKNRSGENDALIAGVGLAGGVRICAAELDRQIFMGSMGTVVGEKLTRLIEKAGNENLPLVVFSASGGARMQEGLYSLMQMAKTSAAIERFRKKGGLFISVMTNPTTGGVSASYASLGDIILAEPNALIGFAGPRVIEQTIRKKLPEGFQRAEFQMEHGFVDKIVSRRDMKETIVQLLYLHGFKPELTENDSEKIGANKGLSGSEYNEEKDGAKAGSGIQLTEENKNVFSLQQKVEHAQTDSLMDENSFSMSTDGELLSSLSNLTAYERLMMVRAAERPKITDYIPALFDDFIELCGDRLGGEDAAIMGGIGLLKGMPVTVIGHRKGKTAEENMNCNFGMASPEGYRKALRLMEEAEKFHRPVITFIDTPGAYPGMEAEEHGQSIAIAENLARMSSLRVPTISIVTGEGNSGGALAIGVTDQIWMLENAVYAILSPEGFASILWKDAKRAAEACDLMKITAPELYQRGFIEKVIPEGNGGIQKNFEKVMESLKESLADTLQKLSQMDTDELINKRYERYRHIEGDMAPTGGEGAENK